MHATSLLDSLTQKGYLGIDRGMILKWILRFYRQGAYGRFIWFTIGFSVGHDNGSLRLFCLVSDYQLLKKY